jgi:hypothetical protein
VMEVPQHQFSDCADDDMFHGDEQDDKVDRFSCRRGCRRKGCLVVCFHDVKSILEWFCMFLVPPDDGHVILTGKVFPEQASHRQE